MLKICEYVNCKKEFETNRSRQKYCKSGCRRFARMKDDPLTGGYLRQNGNRIEAKGFLNCALLMLDLSRDSL